MPQITIRSRRTGRGVRLTVRRKRFIQEKVLLAHITELHGYWCGALATATTDDEWNRAFARTDMLEELQDWVKENAR